MKILIEGERYPIDYLVQIFRSDQFYEPYGNDGKIKFVGYYHDLSNNELVFMLPKVFMSDCRQTVFGHTIDELIDYVGNESVIRDKRLIWMRDLSVYFYKSLMKFRHKFPDSTLINYSPIFQLKGINKTLQYSYLDILLSFLTYYKKNGNQILYKHIDAVQTNPKKPKWEKTVRKGKPILSGDSIIYDRIRAKNKIANNEEQLIVCFFSILNYLNEQHNLGLQIDKVYPVVKGIRFRELMKRGVSKLKKIKYRYYTDSLKEMHTLCLLFFDAHDQGSGKAREDFMTISEYNIVFEDMVDNLFSDDLDDISTNGRNLYSLKYHKDGKILDHIFDHTSLFDDSSIFYIGDSKYYKSGAEAKQESRFKQFAYAKNVIQYNIDLLNEKNRPYKANQQYRDELTEGYNITPNFFIYGYIDKPDDYSLNELKPNGEVQTSHHFKHRLFDRDTLFVHQYKINFLFVLKSYVNLRTAAIDEFRKHARMLFREEFLKYFAEGGKSGYTLYRYNGTEDQTDFVNNNFKLLNGKIYQTIENDLLLAVHKDDDDEKLRALLLIFKEIEIQ
ncbi:hypothetical protein SF1_21750 [Sphingobacterium faecium NBRC 15299]|uniref:hypothetical protein n=1 Tax=Sphingobacterium faecium TaxID=34087 RepID=UPI000D396EB1|nr:hypothetical protein [Sphingobacterium faecium]PTX14113.1 hypothetical protein C8N37_101872 [Sphingobacterium faecium]GEM64193.1 hypothetical protein SF1_21750 [Sphingobacterium faecium NBRC 15299]